MSFRTERNAVERREKSSRSVFEERSHLEDFPSYLVEMTCSDRIWLPPVIMTTSLLIIGFPYFALLVQNDIKSQDFISNNVYCSGAARSQQRLRNSTHAGNVSAGSPSTPKHSSASHPSNSISRKARNALTKSVCPCPSSSRLLSAR